MNNPFTAAAASFAEFRHMEMYNGLPAQLLHHLHPQFLHPGLPFGATGAFRPLVELKTFQTPSAFAPPTKCLKISTSVNDNNEIITSHGTNHSISNMFSPTSQDNRNYPQSHTDSLSPISVSMSPPLGPRSASNDLIQNSSSDLSERNTTISNDGSTNSGTDVKQENLEQQNSDGGPGSESDRNESVNLRLDSVSENQRMFRVEQLYGNNMPENGFNLSTNQHNEYTKSRFMFDQAIGSNKSDNSCCPVCGVCLQSGELESHFLQELERLCKLTCIRNNYERLPPQNINGSGPDHRWEIFERIKNNRQDRLKTKLRKRKADEVCCPICNRGMLRNSDELNVHISQCLRKQRMNNSPNSIQDEDETVDIEGDNSKGYVESSWPEDLRSPKSNSNIHFPRNATPSSTNMSVDHETEGEDGEEEDLIVDADDLRVTTQYSPTHYSSDSEVVQSANSEAQERELLICSPDDAQQSQVNSTVNSSNDEGKSEGSQGQPCDSNVSTSDTGPSSRAQLLKELKAKIRELENNPSTDEEMSAQTDSNYKCLICMENYKNPVISTTCWHVHCEECWLQTLETRKKVCPQCNVVTSSSDLRRIYM
ncbi:E3 ubiquitin-protein ligase Rnf220-like [Chrysoperla carnea]|uniref:E3 ubiquitin-protein ligase Rnf220-like n=1 Tax=Chrysoperla carnea TaxID=189513 RepID=UPI001D07AB47|nr:E3 ubiquitin-protein ligase Rnf220-like [Chrysoperla carnea]